MGSNLRTVGRGAEGDPSALAPVLVVAGLASEAACLGVEGVVAVLSGADVGVLRAALAKKGAEKFSAIVSFGLAGGLDPVLLPGDMIVATGAVNGADRFETHSALRPVLIEGFASADVAAREGVVAGVDTPVMDPAEKAALRQRTQAIAVDMESHVAGAFARARGLPFAIVRAVSDPAARALPALAAKAVKPDGDVDIAFVLKEVAREPAQLGGLLSAGRDSRAAFATLRRCGGLIGPLLRLVLPQLR